MNDRTFLQVQAIQLRELLEDAGDDPILVPQLKQRLDDIEQELAAVKCATMISEELPSTQPVPKGRMMTYHGVIRGKMIELDEPLSLPDGQDVTIEIHPFRPGDGIRASAGTWADAGPELEEWLKRMNDARQSGRSIALP